MVPFATLSDAVAASLLVALQALFAVR